MVRHSGRNSSRKDTSTNRASITLTHADRQQKSRTIQERQKLETESTRQGKHLYWYSFACGKSCRSMTLALLLSTVAQVARS